MDEVERQRFLDTLRRDDDFRATVRRELLTEELLNLPATVATLVDVVALQRQDFTTLATNARDYMERTITLIGEGFTAVRAEISELRTETDSLRTEVETGFTAARTENSELRTDMGILRTDMGILKTDMGIGFTGVDARFDQLNSEIRVIKDQLAS